MSKLIAGWENIKKIKTQKYDYLSLEIGGNIQMKAVFFHTFFLFVNNKNELFF